MNLARNAALCGLAMLLFAACSKEGAKSPKESGAQSGELVSFEEFTLDNGLKVIRQCFVGVFVHRHHEGRGAKTVSVRQFCYGLVQFLQFQWPHDFQRDQCAAPGKFPELLEHSKPDRLTTERSPQREQHRQAEQQHPLEVAAQQLEAGDGPSEVGLRQAAAPWRVTSPRSQAAAQA